ncbi:MAG TPA: hypothetical protein VF590_00660, partial [Isosphaeraceae bacterium]
TATATATATAPGLDAAIAAWLDADEDGPPADRPSDRLTAPTPALGTPVEGSPALRPAAVLRPESKDSSAAAGDLLRAMTGQRRLAKR